LTEDKKKKADELETADPETEQEVAAPEADNSIGSIKDEQEGEPEGNADDVERLSRDLEKAKEKYLRSLADMDNLRKRCRRDIEEARINGRVNVLEELLPSLDSMDMALKSVEPDEASRPVYDGMTMVRKQFLSSMERFQMKPVEAIGAGFDPSLHEAVSYVPNENVEAGVIFEEMRKGYILGERLLRPSMVVVSSGKPATDGENEGVEEPKEEKDAGHEDEGGGTEKVGDAEVDKEPAQQSDEGIDGEQDGDIEDGK